MQLKVRSPRRHHPTAPRSGGRVAGLLLLVLLLFNLAHLQSRPSEEALSAVHAQGACACCKPAPQEPATTGPTDDCCASSAPPVHQVADACCSGDDAPTAQVAPPEPVDEAGCCADGHGSCHCQQASPGLSALLPRPVPLPAPLHLADHLTAPVLSRLEGGLAPPEQPPRA